MDALKKTLAAIPGGNTRRAYGTAYFDGEKWYANMNGNLLDARWLDPIQPIQNGKIVVDITKDSYGLSTALVIGGYTDQPRPSTGVVVTVGVAEIVFTGEDGLSYTTTRFIGSYSPGDPVYLTWDAAAPTIIGVIAAIAVTPSTPPPPAPVQVASGEVPLVATASDTWGVGGWGRWATSQRGGEDVYTGSIGGYTVTGAWFYGAAKPELAGKTIVGARFRLPARMGVGASNSAATIHLYAHTNGARPGSDVNRVAGPHNVSVPAGYTPAHHFDPNLPAGYIALPSSFYGVLAAGGGISISGEPYAAFLSRLDDPESGKTILNWSA